MKIMDGTSTGAWVGWAVSTWPIADMDTFYPDFSCPNVSIWVINIQARDQPIVKGFKTQGCCPV